MKNITNKSGVMDHNYGSFDKGKAKYYRIKVRHYINRIGKDELKELSNQKEVK